MSSNDKPFGCGMIIAAAAGLVGLCILVIVLVRIFAYLGYNLSFYTDNLLYMRGVNPMISWALLGIFAGSIVGVLVSAKKRRLPNKLVLYPIGVTVVFLITMGFINKPSRYDAPFIFSSNEQKTVEPVSVGSYYLVTSDVNVRTGPSTQHAVLGSLTKGAEIEVVNRNFYDSNYNEWFMVNYNGRTGYVNSKFLTFRR